MDAKFCVHGGFAISNCPWANLWRESRDRRSKGGTMNAKKLLILLAGGAIALVTMVVIAAATEPNQGYEKYTPDWSRLSTDCPRAENVLKAHGLTMDMLMDNAVVPSRNVSWEPCLVVIELDAEHRGTEIPLLNGYAYDAAPVDTDVTLFWGGDPNVRNVKLQWGTSFRYGPAYQAVKEGWWLDPSNAIEWATRSVRFGRYWRNAGLGISDVPYFGRTGPYYVRTGNLDVQGWVPPSVDAVQPRDWRDATAMLGGLARQSEWTTDGTNWAWKYTDKVAGSGDYCPQGNPCWQTTYVPQASLGYIELWDGQLDAPRKFYARDLALLISGRYNVDEFSYHPFPD